MKFLMQTLSFAFITAPLPILAGTPPEFPASQKIIAEQSTEEIESATDEDQTEIDLSADLSFDERREEWNQWVCQAYSQGGNLRSFNGRSFFFRPGSGEGQEAKRQARREAVRKCEFRTGQNCRSNLDKDCRVRRIERP